MSVACVNTGSPVFKEKAKELGISEGQLENILHEYNNSPALQSQMSEEDFITSKLEGTPNNKASSLMVKAWEAKYSKPMEYATIQEFNAARQVAAEIFGESSIGHKETPDGRHMLSIGKPRTEASSLWRGIPGRPTIDSEGNLIISAGYDNLFKGYGVSFATREGPAYSYGRRNSTNPFIIRIDREALDALYPFDENGGTKSVGSRVIGDEYGEDSYEERVIMSSAKDVIVIPKGHYSIEHTPVNTEGMTSADIAEAYIQSFDQANIADEMVFSQVEGHASFNDADELFDALVRKTGSKQNAYLVLAAVQSYYGYTTTEHFENLLDDSHRKEYDSLFDVVPIDEWGSVDVVQNKKFDELTRTTPKKHSYLSSENGEDLPFNRQPKTPVSVLQDARLINSYATPLGWYAVNGLNEIAEENLAKVRAELSKYGFVNKIDVRRRADQRGRTHILVSFGDVISRDAVHREAVKDLKSIHSVVKFLTDKIPTLQGHIHEISVADADKLLDGKLQKNETAFIRRGEVYLIKGRVTKDAAIEEELHIITLAMQYDNAELYNSLVKEAKQAFPDLLKDIQLTYEKGDVNNEIITQALARVFRQEYDSTSPKNRKTISELVNKFIEWFSNLFNKFIKNSFTGRYVVELNKLPRALKLSDMADFLLAPDSEFAVVMPVVNRNVFNKNTEALDISTTEFFSGKAPGSDTVWAQEARDLGIKVTDYTTDDYDALSPQEKDRIEREYVEARGFLGKPVLSATTEGGKLTRRDMMQADSADAIFAIAEQITPPGGTEYSGGKAYINRSGHDNVAGGTANAVARGIIRGIPVYVFDQSSKQWKVWDVKTRSFVVTDEPTLTPRAATIGTRGIDESGNLAISRILHNSLIQKPQQQASVQREVESPLQYIRPENRAFFQRQQLLRRKMDALYENEVGLTSNEIDEEATKLAEWISDNITEIQLHPEKYYEIFGKEKTNGWATDEDRKADIDKVTAMSRREIAANISIKQFLNTYRQEIFIDNEAIDDLVDERDRDKVDLLRDSVDVLFELGMATFNDNEGYSVVHNDELDTEEQVESQKDDTHPEGIPDDGSDVQEEYGNLEDWMLDKTTIEVLGNATALIRSALGKLYHLNEDGSIKTDYLGRRERVSQNDAVKSIIRWTQGSLNIGMMVQKLEAKLPDNPWLSTILEKLHDKSGNQADFISQFYTVFQKHFQLFDVIKKDSSSKRDFAMDVNSSPALANIYNYVVAMRAIGEAPLFTSGGINRSALSQWAETVARLKANYNVTEDQFNQYKDGFVRRFAMLARLLGYEFKSEDIKKSLTYDNFKKAVDAASNILGNLNEEINNPEYNPYQYIKGGHYISGYVKDMLRELSHSIEDVTESSFYENGKMRQSNQIPSYASKLFLKLRGDAATFNKTLEEEFGKYEWFRNSDGTWRMPWMKELSKMDEETRKKVLVHKVNLNYRGDQYMRGLTAERYTLATLTEFASGKESGKSTQIAFYGFPIESNAATSDYVSFYRYTGDLYKSVIKNGVMSIFSQELSRIQTVRMRDRKPEDADYISGFDERGKKFCLLDFFNDPESLVRENGLIDASEASELAELIESKVSGEEVDEARLNVLAKKAIEENFNQRYEELLRETKRLGLIDAIGNIEGVIAKVSKFNKTQQVEQFIENFVWNDAFAKMNIIEMLVTDPAFYQNDDDFQKRFKQVHSPGNRGNAEATDYEGKRVSDGYLRAMVLKDGIIDGKTLKNNMIENLEIILDQQIEQASESSKEAARALKDSILSQMNDINITDGQAFSGLTATRKKGFIFGTWSREAEALYNKLRSGEATLSDIKVAFNVDKPFIYTQLSQKVHSLGTPLSTLKVPTQIKDSEYLLVMAAAMLEHAETGKPNLLKVLYDVMEETAFDTVNGERVHNNKGIDIFVFESAVKSGLTGVSDITSKWVNGEYNDASPEQAEQSLRRALIDEIYASDTQGNTVFDEEGRPAYDDIKVKAIPVEDYAMQSKVPLHMLDQTEMWGSQIRAIIESNLAYVDFEGNPVKFTFTDAQGVEHSLGRDEFVQRYESSVAEVINSSIDRTIKEFGLFGENLIDTKVAIAKELQKEIKSNPQRYGNDLLLACTIDEDGNFRIPPGDPIQSKRIEQLINSIVKNRVNKVKVPGGLAVQVTNFGTSRRLNYRFFMKDGKTLLPTRDEWLAKNEGKTETDYKEFCRENQGGFAYEEHYAPAHTRAFYSLLSDHNGEIDLEAVEMLDENLLLSIDKRTPTEYFYSVTVAKTVGFLPREAGDGDMGPYEGPGVNDSDFDVDKQSKWKKSFKIVRNKGIVTNKMLKDSVPELDNIQLTEEEKAEVEKQVQTSLSWSGLTEEQYEKRLPKLLEKELEKARQKKIYGIIKDFRNVPFGTPSRKDGIDRGDLFRALKKAYVRLAFSVEYPTEGEKASVNDAWEMTRSVIQHPTNAGKKLSPGGPEQVTHIGYLVGALKTGKYTEEQLSGMSTKELGKIAKGANMNLVYFYNQLEYYRRNNDASSNLGIFAVAASAHNILEGEGYAVHNEEEFTIAGKRFGTEIEIDAMLNEDGEVISKLLGANVAAAADAAKVPSHAFLNINKNTINEFIFLVRAGMSFTDTCLFIASNPIENIIRRFNAANISQYRSLDSIIEERIEQIKQDHGIEEDSQIYDEDLSRGEIFTAHGERVPATVELKSLLMFQRIRRLVGGMRMATFATRYNSVSSATGPQIIDNLIYEKRANEYGAPSYADADFEHIPLLLQKRLDIQYAREDNRPVRLGDVVVDADGNNVVITPQNLDLLKEQGVLNVKEDYDEVFLDDVLNAHPMLKAFSQGYAMADRFFDILNMPAASSQFRSIIDSDRNVSTILYGDAKLLSMFSDFYQSTLMVASGVISTKNSRFDGPEYYLRRFPALFLRARDRYKGNALIDAIQPEVTDNGTILLKLSTTGLKNKERAKLQAAWNQLYSQSPKLAVDLFKYNFWRGGIGFSPKTFINMLPIQMKEKIEGYIDTFKDMPYVNSANVIDQFFRNNMMNGKLVRTVDISNGNVEIQDGNLIFNEEKFDDVSRLPFIKVMDENGAFYLFKQTFVDKKNKTVTFTAVSPLGNNGEFVEISANSIEKPMLTSDFAESVVEDNPNTDREPLEPAEPAQPMPRTDAQIEAEIQEFMQYLKGPNGEYLSDVAPAGVMNLVRRAKQGKIKLDLQVQKKNIKDLFERNGIKYSEEKIEEIVKLMC